MYGHSRSAIYISNLIITIVASLICEIIFLLIVFLVGNLIYGNIQIPVSNFIMNIINTMLTIISFCTIYNFITIICSDITISTTLCICIFIAMFILASSTSYALADVEPVIKKYEINSEGEKILVSEEENPNYPGTVKYNIMKAIYLLNPESQATEIQNNNQEYSYQMPIYSLGLILAINLVGIWIFKEKQLK